MLSCLTVDGAISGEPRVHQGQRARGELDAEQEQRVHQHAQHDEEPGSGPQKVMCVHCPHGFWAVGPSPLLRLGVGMGIIDDN